jgi:hypothetical protein
MSETKDDGGSAFPTLETEQYHPQFGMSLRDYFAAAALTGLLGCNDGALHEEAAEDAYDYADAMLRARKP